MTEQYATAVPDDEHVSVPVPVTVSLLVQLTRNDVQLATPPPHDALPEPVPTTRTETVPLGKQVKTVGHAVTPLLDTQAAEAGEAGSSAIAAGSARRAAVRRMVEPPFVVVRRTGPPWHRRGRGVNRCGSRVEPRT